MSDRGIPASYRHMHGYGSHTYSFWNEAGERFWVKFHFHTQQGIKNLTDAEPQQSSQMIVKVINAIYMKQSSVVISLNGHYMYKLCLKLMQKKSSIIHST